SLRARRSVWAAACNLGSIGALLVCAREHRAGASGLGRRSRARLRARRLDAHRAHLRPRSGAAGHKAPSLRSVEGGSARGWRRRGLVIAEMALALVLLSGGGLLSRSVARLSSVDPGFRTDHLLTLEVYPPYSKYPDTRRRAAFYDELLRRAGSLPGVEAA